MKNIGIQILNKPSFISVVFTFFLIFTWLPILQFHYFPTVDGPAHLYNAHIIRELWFGDGDFYRAYFHFNPQLVPNWTGHLLAVFAGMVLPVWAVEKLLLLIIIAGTPLSIFYLLKALNAEVNWNIFLLLPFTYTLPLYLGFYNYLIAVPFFLLTLSVFVNSKSEMKAGHWIGMSCLTILVYFSHLMVFMLLAISVFIYHVWIVVLDRQVKLFTKLNFQKAACFVPGLILSVGFFMQKGFAGYKGESNKLSFDFLLEWLINGAPFIGLNAEKEAPAVSMFILLITLVFLIAVVSRILKKSGFHKNDFTLLFALLILILYFVVPDGIAAGGFVSIRLVLLFYLFIAIWIGMQRVNVFGGILIATAASYLSFATMDYRLSVARELDAHANEMIVLSQHLEPRSTCLPLNYSGNWLHTNLSNYIGASQKVVIMDNYETKFNEFPLKWNEQVAPGDDAGTFAKSTNPTITIDQFEKRSNSRINYLTRWMYDTATHDSTSEATSVLILKNFTATEKTINGELFRRN